MRLLTLCTSLSVAFAAMTVNVAGSLNPSNIGAFFLYLTACIACAAYVTCYLGALLATILSDLGKWLYKVAVPRGFTLSFTWGAIVTGNSKE